VNESRMSSNEGEGDGSPKVRAVALPSTKCAIWANHLVWLMEGSCE
jgi:hypothetical protein